jgi:hypothetical protein
MSSENRGLLRNGNQRCDSHDRRDPLTRRFALSRKERAR